MPSLFEAARAGDAEAEGAIVRLVRSAARQIWRGGMPACAPDMDWEDVAQEASRQIFSVGLRQFRGHSSESRYIYAVVRSAAIQVCRSATRRKGREQAVAVNPEPVENDPGMRLEIEAVLGRLSSECSDLIRSVFLLDRTYADLANELSMAESSVRSKLSRCLRSAREIATGEQRS